MTKSSGKRVVFLLNTFKCIYLRFMTVNLWIITTNTSLKLLNF